MNYAIALIKLINLILTFFLSVKLHTLGVVNVMLYWR